MRREESDTEFDLQEKDKRALEALFEGLVAYIYLIRRNVVLSQPHNENLKKIPPLYLYVTTLLCTYPFTKVAIQYVCNWPKEIKKRYRDPSLLKVAEEARNDEKGHDQLIVKDLTTLKIPIKEALQVLKSKTTASWVKAFSKSVSEDPLYFLAWLYLFEEFMNQSPPHFLTYWKGHLGSQSKALRFFKVHAHSALEMEHTIKREKWIKALPKDLQLRVIQELFKIASQLPSLCQFDLDSEIVINYLKKFPHLSP